MHNSTFSIRPRGAFSLEESNNFGFGHRHEDHWDGTMRLAFCVDGYRDHAAVELTQTPDGVVQGVAQGSGDADAVEKQVARMLSLDHDAAAYEELGERDAVIGRLLAAAPGLRPPLFHSPYEAAAWAIISARRPARQMAVVRDAIGEAYGATYDVAGKQVHAFPTARRLLDIETFPGLSQQKIERLHALANAALDGLLDAERLQALEPEVAMEQMRTLPGIGPFYSSLIVIRAAGLTDVPVCEPHAMEMAARLWELPRTLSDVEFLALAEGWRPFRTWVTVLIRAAGKRVLDPA